MTRAQRTRQFPTGEFLESRICFHSTALTALASVGMPTEARFKGAIETPPVPFPSAITVVGNQPTPRVVGGTDASEGEYPWMVSLQGPNFRHFCGGSLITPTVVVTAAHCVDGVLPNDFQAVTGRTNLTTNVGRRHNVSQVYVHPNFNILPLDSDVAVLVLSTPSQSATLPLLLPAEATLANPGVVATVTGWGQTATDTRPVRLQEARVPILSNAVANSPQYLGGGVTENMLAAGHDFGLIDACFGDSGGPLTVPDVEGNPRLAGIVSWGESSCAEPFSPTVYTRVTQFTDWILSRIPSNTGRLDIRPTEVIATARVSISLVDLNVLEGTRPTVSISATGGDRESWTLTPGANGFYQATVPLSNATAIRGNGRMEVRPGQTYNVFYQDLNDGSDNSVEVREQFTVIAEDHGNNSLHATHIAANSLTAGNIEIETDVDWFSFDAQSGAFHRFEVLLTGSLSDSYLRLFDSDGVQQLDFDDDGGVGLGSLIEWTPQTSGKFYLEVSGFASSHVGTYSLRFDQIADDHGDSAANATAVATNSQTPGEFERDGDVDWFRGNAQPGDVIDVRAISDANLGRVVVSLYDGNGTTLVARTDNGDSAARWSLRGGVFYVAVNSLASSDRGTYSLDMSVRAVDRSNDDHGNVAADSTLVAMNASVKGDIDYQSDADVFAFDAVAGDHVTANLRLVTLADAVVDLYDTDGRRLLRWQQIEGSQVLGEVSWAVTHTGRYYVLVAPLALAQLGSYELQVANVTPDHLEVNNSPGNATDLRSRNVNIRGLNLHSNTDVDWFRWTAAEDGNASFQIDFTHSDGDLDLRLYNAAGQLLQSSNSSANRESIARSVSEGEVFLIQVRGWAGSLNPSYSLLIDGPERAQPDAFEENDTSQTAFALPSVNQVQTGLSLHSRTDVDWFTWTPVVSGQLTVSASVVRGKGPIRVSIVDSEGTTMTEELGQASTEVRRGQLYRIHVMSPVGEATSSYQLSILGSTPGVGDINLDGLVDAADVAAIHHHWGKTGVADISRDGIVDGGDLSILYAHWSGGTANDEGPAAARATAPVPVAPSAPAVDAVWSAAGIRRRSLTRRVS